MLERDWQVVAASRLHNVYVPIMYNKKQALSSGSLNQSILVHLCYPLAAILVHRHPGVTGGNHRVRFTPIERF